MESENTIRVTKIGFAWSIKNNRHVLFKEGNWDSLALIVPEYITTQIKDAASALVNCKTDIKDIDYAEVELTTSDVGGIVTTIYDYMEDLLVYIEEIKNTPPIESIKPTPLGEYKRSYPEPGHTYVPMTTKTDPYLDGLFRSLMKLYESPIRYASGT